MVSYERCNLCAHNCNINRNEKLGLCKASCKIKIAKVCLYMYEEPCISGSVGSGAVFFSGCNMRCIYCQNYKISNECLGKEVSIYKLANIFLKLQKDGALNINLVTPTHYVPSIVEALKLAKDSGLSIPIIYNTSSYENIDTIKMLDGLIDVYLPDLKYFNDSYAVKYSKSKNYFKVASSAINEMYKQVGKVIFDKDGIIKKGVIVRHLILPTLENDSKEILKYLYNTYKNNIYISIMNQYTPVKKYKYEELNNKINNKVYNEIIDYAYDLGIRNAYVQEEGTVSESFIPDWDI